VASQLKTLIPVGTAIVIEAIMKKASTLTPIGTANMWCAQTNIDRSAMPAVEAAIALQPKIGLRGKTGSTSEISPKPGRIMM
jgi:hypothetical protein